MAMHLPIIAACDLRCVFCSANGRGGGFELDSLLRQIDDDKSGRVQISGGEPLLRPFPELLRILLHCRKRRKRVELQSNALAAGDLDSAVLAKIADYVDFFNVNLSAHEPGLDRRVTGRAGGFKRRVAGVRSLLATRRPVRLTHVVHGINLSSLADFVGFVANELPGVSWIQFSFVKAVGRAKADRRIVPRYARAAPFLVAALRRCRDLGIPFDVDHIPACFLGEFAGRHVDLRKTARGQTGPFQEEKAQVGECAGCKLRRRCPGPRKDYIQLYKTL